MESSFDSNKYLVRVSNAINEPIEDTIMTRIVESHVREYFQRKQLQQQLQQLQQQQREPSKSFN